VAANLPAVSEVRRLVARELGEPVDEPRPLTTVRSGRMTWAAETPRTGPIVIKLRRGDDALEKTRWCAAHLPALAARGYPVPAILGHGLIGGEWHVTVQNRLPGRPLTALTGSRLGQVLRLTELQAAAGIPAGDRDFTGYVAHVLFDDWDDVWADAPRACAAAGPLCARLQRWLQPVWGFRLPATDYAHNDFNLSNILADGAAITGVVDWDEFGLGSRALDLVALAFDCQRGGDPAAAGRLLDRAAQVAGPGGLRCLVSYRAIASLAHTHQERAAYGEALAGEECVAIAAILGRLQAGAPQAPEDDIS
jgi:aminoglycoside phosphotransferase (APT) family kinase protein